MTQLLFAGNLDFQKKVLNMFSEYHNCYCTSLSIGAETVTGLVRPDDAGELPFFLDDLGCSGSERNLLDCLPQHNCAMSSTPENAGVQCLRKGKGTQKVD